jgi:PBSX family phage terminase large subunit
MEITYLPTGQRIVFRGADKPEKLKSIKFQHGYPAVIWFEELDSFLGMREIRSILQSLMRGGEDFWVFGSYNPPMSRDNWTAKEAAHKRADRMVHSSTYLDVPRAWLGEQFSLEAAELALVSPLAYKHEYLGEITGTGGNVYNNVTVRTITAEERKTFDRLYNGVDWGFATDPWIFERMHHDATRHKLYLFDERKAFGASNAETAEMVKQALTYANSEHEKPFYHAELVICDSADPQNVSEYHNLGINSAGAAKPAYSVKHGTKWMQNLAEIIIDPDDAPTAAEEFVGYEYLKTREGEFCSQLPDKDNHAQDATRYAMAPVIFGTGY